MYVGKFFGDFLKILYIPHTQTENQPPVEAVEDEAVAEEPGPVGTGYYSPATPVLSRKCFFSPPRGIPGQKLLFANKCLLVAAIFGIWRIRAAVSRYNHDCESEDVKMWQIMEGLYSNCLLYTSPSPRDLSTSRMPSSA